MTFFPAEDYGIADVEDDIRRRDSDWQVGDLIDNLRLWGLKYLMEMSVVDSEA